MHTKFGLVVAMATLMSVPVGAESPSYAQQGRNISFHNTPNRHPAPINAVEPTVIATVNVDIAQQADVFVNFTSGIAADTGEGCPCSVRALLKLDDQDPIVVKRVNVASPAVQDVDKYEHDRQSIDGSYVFSVPAGKHTISLVYQQVAGSSKLMEIYYPNVQALVFPR